MSEHSPKNHNILTRNVKTVMAVGASVLALSGCGALKGDDTYVARLFCAPELTPKLVDAKRTTYELSTVAEDGTKTTRGPIESIAVEVACEDPETKARYPLIGSESLSDAAQDDKGNLVVKTTSFFAPERANNVRVIQESDHTGFHFWSADELSVSLRGTTQSVFVPREN